MSAGDFTTVGYTRNNGDVHPIRVQPETLAANFTPGGSNAGAAIGTVTNDIEARARGSRRSRGLIARYVTCRWTGTPPTGYTGRSFSIPIMLPATFSAITRASTVTYLGAAARVTGKFSESPVP